MSSSVIKLAMAAMVFAGCPSCDRQVKCGEDSFPRSGDLCSEADREAGIICRQCSCGAGCCDSCECGEDLRWSCDILCVDAYWDGGSESCDLGTSPRCLSNCAP